MMIISYISNTQYHMYIFIHTHTTRPSLSTTTIHIRLLLGDAQGAFDDLTMALKLQPQHAQAHRTGASSVGPGETRPFLSWRNLGGERWSVGKMEFVEQKSLVKRRDV